MFYFLFVNTHYSVEAIGSKSDIFYVQYNSKKVLGFQVYPALHTAVRDEVSVEYIFLIFIVVRALLSNN